MSNAFASVPPAGLDYAAPPRARSLPRASTCRPLDAGELALARAAVAEFGLCAAARRLDLERHTLASAAGGARLREGTRMVIADRLRRLAEAGR